MSANNSFKRVLKIYGFSVLLYAVVMFISIIIHVKLRLGDNPAFPKAVILVIIGSFFYALCIAILNLTQFLVIKWKKLQLLAYFFPVLLSLAAYVYTLIYDDSHPDLSANYFAVHACTTAVAYYLYQRKK
ncbi:hypothetical protein [uncultured Kordia sp.]|uniref:hypothetical protein n=1 Tax=uncultured Kordia sp. TaxID=507699 RepID=UPI00261C9360|nr:hypothetical protein [uncultured Kordia sp.]